jgi:hypothetical protein
MALGTHSPDSEREVKWLQGVNKETAGSFLSGKRIEVSMKEELQGKLVEILTSIQTATGKASDFAMSQLPDVAQSYVGYGRALYTVGVVLGALFLLACVALSGLR